MLETDLQQIISQAISFLLLFLVLRKFAWPGLLNMLDARRAKIAEDLRKAEQARDDMHKLQEELTVRLAKIDEEARANIQQSTSDGKQKAMQIQEEARQQAQSILKKSEEAVVMELAKARVTLRNQVADMTIAALERILKQKLDEKADQKLIEQVLDELEAAGANT